MTLRYKLVTQDYKTRKGWPNETTWEIGKRVEATGDPKQGLCSSGYLHCYDSPELAIMLNALHARIDDPRILAVQCHGRSKNDWGLKRGYRAMTPVREVDVPYITEAQMVRFAILCALEVYHGQKWVAWARDWLSGKDRTAARAYAIEPIADKDSVAASLATGAARSTGDEVKLFVAHAIGAAAVTRDWRDKKRLDLVKLARKAMEG